MSAHREEYFTIVEFLARRCARRAGIRGMPDPSTTPLNDEVKASEPIDEEHYSVSYEISTAVELMKRLERDNQTLGMNKLKEMAEREFTEAERLILVQLFYSVYHDTTNIQGYALLAGAVQENSFSVLVESYRLLCEESVLRTKRLIFPIKTPCSEGTGILESFFAMPESVKAILSFGADYQPTPEVQRLDKNFIDPMNI